MQNQAFFMMHWKGTVTTVQCGHKRVLKLLILWLKVLAMGESELNLTTGKFTYEALVVHEALKSSRLFTILFFPDFFGIQDPIIMNQVVQISFFKAAFTEGH